MKTKLSLLLLLLLSFAPQAKAQYETILLNQWLNQMTMDTYRQQQQLTDMFLKTVEQESKRQLEAASATCLLLPTDNFTFFARISLLYVSGDNVEIYYTPEGGSSRLLPASDYVCAAGEIVTPAIFKPGTSVRIYHKITDKLLASQKIPSRSSSTYAAFVTRQRIALQNLSAQSFSAPDFTSGSTSVDGSGISVPSKTCSLCKGKGWIAGSKSPTYGNNSRQWCSTCDREVNASHSHDRCPSCSGRGKTY